MRDGVAGCRSVLTEFFVLRRGDLLFFLGGVGFLYAHGVANVEVQGFLELPFGWQRFRIDRVGVCRRGAGCS